MTITIRGGPTGAGGGSVVKIAGTKEELEAGEGGGWGRSGKDHD